jgi:predicted Zn-dependent protease
MGTPLNVTDAIVVGTVTYTNGTWCSTAPFAVGHRRHRSPSTPSAASFGSTIQRTHRHRHGHHSTGTVDGHTDGHTDNVTDAIDTVGSIVR